MFLFGKGQYGSYSLYVDSENKRSGWDNPNIYSKSGLPDYPEQGDVFKFDIKIADAGTGFKYTYFGFQDWNNSYKITQTGGREIKFQKISGGSTTTFETESFDVEGEWVECEVNWQSDGDIIVTLKHSQGETVLSGTDSEFTSGGIAFENKLARAKWDYMRK